MQKEIDMGLPTRFGPDYEGAARVKRERAIRERHEKYMRDTGMPEGWFNALVASGMIGGLVLPGLITGGGPGNFLPAMGIAVLAFGGPIFAGVGLAKGYHKINEALKDEKGYDGKMRELLGGDWLKSDEPPIEEEYPKNSFKEYRERAIKDGLIVPEEVQKEVKDLPPLLQKDRGLLKIHGISGEGVSENSQEFSEDSPKITKPKMG